MHKQGPVDQSCPVTTFDFAHNPYNKRGGGVSLKHILIFYLSFSFYHIQFLHWKVENINLIKKFKLSYSILGCNLAHGLQTN